MLVCVGNCWAINAVGSGSANEAKDEIALTLICICVPKVVAGAVTAVDSCGSKGKEHSWTVDALHWALIEVSSRITRYATSERYSWRKQGRAGNAVWPVLIILSSKWASAWNWKSREGIFFNGKASFASIGCHIIIVGNTRSDAALNSIIKIIWPAT
jgi:hypothetical protein